MKKFLLIALVLFCISCKNNHTEVRYLGKEEPRDEIPFNRITHFNYNGHKYIKFEETYGNASVSGVVHDPDCWCSKNKDKNEHRTVN